MSDLTEQRRTSFDAAACAYDNARPGYPEQMVDAILSYAQLPARPRALEVGSGTGQATAQFAWRGIAVDAIEPGAAMAALTREKFDGSGLEVTVQVADFESAEIEPGAYDLVLASTSWHWLTPGARWERVSEALRPGGAIAAFWTLPHWRRTPLRPALDAAYERSGADLATLGPMADVEVEHDLLARQWLLYAPRREAFSDLRSAVYRWTELYDAAGYAELLSTYGDHLALDPAVRETLLEGVRGVVDEAGGEIEVHYSTHLLLARASATVGECAATSSRAASA